MNGWIKGRKLFNITEEYKFLLGSSGRNKIWITNGINSIRIEKTDIIPNGWHLGRTFKNK